MFAQKTCPSVEHEDDDLRNAFWTQLYPGYVARDSISSLLNIVVFLFLIEKLLLKIISIIFGVYALNCFLVFKQNCAHIYLNFKLH